MIRRIPHQHDGSSFRTRACMAAGGTGSLVFIDDVTDGGSRMKSEV